MAVVLVPVLLGSCNTEKARGAPDRIKFERDPIVVHGVGEVSRAEFRRFVARRLAGKWLVFLALDRAVAAELADAEMEGPSRAVIARIHGWVGEGLLREWLPERNREWKSEKGEWDLAWCLGRIWVLEHGAGEPEQAKLVALFEQQVAERKPVLVAKGDVLARCEGYGVGVCEVYPDLLALLTDARRQALAREAAGAF